jgi:pyridinium-3,5-bisthiocarboxylic acid mononucleotide nickel chelatase
MGQRIAYFDCFSGAAGDMLLAACLDAGLSLDDLRADLAALGLGDYELRAQRQVRRGIAGCTLEVHDCASQRELHNWPAVRHLVAGSTLPEPVMADSLRVLQRLAEAEATVHGVPVEEVHFHEVGALDTLVDIVGFCSAMRRFGVQRIYASALPLGMGAVRTEHGLLPVPAPATLALLAEVGAPVQSSPRVGVEVPGELVTPTGAAILSTLAEFSRPAMRVQRVGYGLGSKEFPWANLLRLWLGEAESEGAVAQGHAHAPAYEQEPEGEHGHTHAHGEEHDHPHAHEH